MENDLILQNFDEGSDGMLPTTSCSLPSASGISSLPSYVSDCGRVTLYLGDCRDILPALGAVDACITDPPYGISVGTRHSKKVNLPPHSGKGKKPFGGKDWKPVEGDQIAFDPAPFLKWDKVVLWGANNYARALPDSPSWLAWDKCVPEGFRKSQVELAWMRGAGRCSHHFKHLWHGICRGSETGSESLHPTQKPIALMAWCIDKAKVQQGATVLDPYMGSGSTILAAIRTGRKAIGIEIDPTHYATAIKRIKNELSQMKLNL